MTWITKTVNEDDEEEKRIAESRRIAIGYFESTQDKNIQTIKQTMTAVSQQGLTVVLKDTDKPVFIHPTQNRVRTNRYKQFFYEPWDFRYCEESKLIMDCHPGVRWVVTVPSQKRSIALNICLFKDLLVFRSGYRNTAVPGTVFEKSEVSPSFKYGLEKKVRYTQYRITNHEIFGSIQSEIDDFYGETTTTNIETNNIINIIYDWFKFAAQDI